MDNKERALAVGSFVLVLRHQPATQPVNLLLSLLTLLIVSALTLKAG